MNVTKISVIFSNLQREWLFAQVCPWLDQISGTCPYHGGWTKQPMAPVPLMLTTRHCQSITAADLGGHLLIIMPRRPFSVHEGWPRRTEIYFSSLESMTPFSLKLFSDDGWENWKNWNTNISKCTLSLWRSEITWKPKEPSQPRTWRRSFCQDGMSLTMWAGGIGFKRCLMMISGKTSKAQNMHQTNQKHLEWQMPLNSKHKSYHL